MTEQQLGRFTRPRWIDDAALWLALLVAFSPTLYDLFGHWHEHSWSRYSLGFVPLLVLAVRADAPGRRNRGPALALIVACVLGQFLASFVSLGAVARPLVGAAVGGLLLYRNRAGLRSALLALFLIPAPSMLMTRWLGGGELASSLAQAAAWLVNALGASAEAVGPNLMLSGSKLEVLPYWGGVLLAIQGLGLAWYVSARRNLGTRATAVALVSAVLLAFPVQFAVLLVSVLVLWAGPASLAAMLLDPGSWLVPLFAALQLGHRAEAASADRS